VRRPEHESELTHDEDVRTEGRLRRRYISCLYPLCTPPSSALGEDGLVHPGDHLAYVRVREVGIALHHGEGLVPQDCRNVHRGSARHREVACRRVAKVVEAEVPDPGRSDRPLPGFPEARGSLPLCAREDEIRIPPAQGGEFLEDGQGMAGQRKRARLAIFGTGEAGHAACEIDVRKTEGEEFPRRAPVERAKTTSG
jgi:hypothetical protein